MLTSPGIIYHTQTTDSCYMCYILPYKLYNNLLFVKLNFKTFHGANISTQYFVVNDLICTISNLKSTYCMCTLQVTHDHMVCMHVYVRELVQVILLNLLFKICFVLFLNCHRYVVVTMIPLIVVILTGIILTINSLNDLELNQHL